jgi:hypothetical protein
MLRPFRQIESLNVDYITLNTMERGGIMSLGSASGMTIAEYALVASGAIPLGLAYNDVENLDRSREYDPRRLREVEVPLGIVGIATQGDYETDWIHAVGTIKIGDAAYVGPSGMLTNDSGFAGFRVGTFISALKPNRHLVLFKGNGFHREKVDPDTKLPVQENDPANRVWLVSNGFIKVRITQRDIIRSQASS